MWADPGGGYAILILLLLGVLGATMAPGGLRNRERAPRRVIAAALLVGAALTLLWPTLRIRVLGQQAIPGTPRTVAGVWVYGVDTLSLSADGSYWCRGAACAGFAQRGTWTSADSGRVVARWDDGHHVTWRTVRYNGRDRLGLVPTPGMDATWSAGLTFARVSP